MIFPYSTDRTEEFVGYGSVGILAIFVIVFGLTWSSMAASAQAQVQMAVDQAVAHQVARVDSLTRLAAEAKEEGREEIPTSTPHLGGMINYMGTAAQGMDSSVLAGLVVSSPAYRFGFDPARGKWFPGLVTHQFLHSGLFPFVVSLLFFFAFAVALERRFGLMPFLLFFVGGGALAALAQTGLYAALHHGALPNQPLVGASGAIGAAMGGFVRCYPQAQVKMVIWVFRPKFGKIPAILFVVFWFLVSLLTHLIPSAGVSMANFLTTICGFSIGLLIAPLFPLSDAAQDELEAARPRGPGGLSLGAKPVRSTGFTVFEQDSHFVPDTSMTPIEQAWDAWQKHRPTAEVSELFRRQFEDWYRNGGTFLENLAIEVVQVCDKIPEVEFESFALWEWGMKLSQLEHFLAARVCLERAQLASPPLSPALAARCAETLEKLPLRPEVIAQSLAQALKPASGNTSPDAKPDWLIH